MRFSAGRSSQIAPNFALPHPSEARPRPGPATTSCEHIGLTWTRDTSKTFIYRYPAKRGLRAITAKVRRCTEGTSDSGLKSVMRRFGVSPHAGTIASAVHQAVHTSWHTGVFEHTTRQPRHRLVERPGCLAVIDDAAGGVAG